MNREPSSRPDRPVHANHVAKIKAVQPVTSTSPPSFAVVTDESRRGIVLWVRQYMAEGTIVQLHIDGDFSLWKVLCCIPDGDSYHMALELVKPMSARDF